MLNQLCDFLDGFNEKNSLSTRSFSALSDLIEDVYGYNAVVVFQQQWEMKEEHWYCIVENPSEAFRLCLTGVG